MDTIVNNFSKTTVPRDGTGVTISWKDESDHLETIDQVERQKTIDLTFPKIIKITKKPSLNWPAITPSIEINCTTTNLLTINAIECKHPSCSYIFEGNCSLDSLAISEPQAHIRCLVNEDDPCTWTINPENVNSFCLNITKKRRCWARTLSIAAMLAIPAGVWAVVCGNLSIRIIGLVLFGIGIGKLVLDRIHAEGSPNDTITIGEPIP